MSEEQPDPETPRPTPAELIAAIWADIDRLRDRRRAGGESTATTVPVAVLGPLWPGHEPVANPRELDATEW